MPATRLFRRKLQYLLLKGLFVVLQMDDEPRMTIQFISAQYHESQSLPSTFHLGYLCHLKHRAIDVYVSAAESSSFY